MPAMEATHDPFEDIVIDEANHQYALRQLDRIFAASLDPSTRTFTVQLAGDPESQLGTVWVAIDGCPTFGRLSFKARREWGDAIASRPGQTVKCRAQLRGGGGKPYGIAIDLESLRAALRGEV